MVFCDIDRDTYLMDIRNYGNCLQLIRRALSRVSFRWILRGYPHQMEEFRKLADEYGLWILEDACHAPGGYFTDSKGEKQLCGNGRYADVAVFSFHPVKHIATGEGDGDTEQ